MLTVSTTARAPVRIDLGGGASILLKAPGTTAKELGHSAARAALILGESPAVAGIAFTMALACWGVISWEGIGDETGAPLPVSPETITSLLEEHPRVYAAVDREYVGPIIAQDAEKNVSAPAPDGTLPGSSRKTPTARAQVRGAGATTAPAAKKPARPAKPARVAPTPAPNRPPRADD